MEKQFLPPIKIQHAKIKYRNFRGVEQDYNPEGRRIFTLVIGDKEMAQRIKDDGWNLRYKENKYDPDAEPEAQLKVRVNYEGKYPPTVKMRTETSDFVELTKETVGQLDTAEIVNIDLEVVPSRWERRDGSSGITAYLKKMEVVIEEDNISTGYGDYIPY